MTHEMFHLGFPDTDADWIVDSPNTIENLDTASHPKVLAGGPRRLRLRRWEAGWFLSMRSSEPVVASSLDTIPPCVKSFSPSYSSD
jgi:hypothetical protein